MNPQRPDGAVGVALYRGDTAIMAAELAGTAHCGLRAQVRGDAHLLELGMFETPEPR